MSGSCSTCSGDTEKKGLPPGILRKYDINQSTAEGSILWIETVCNGETVSISDSSKELVGRLRKIEDSRIFGVIFGGIEAKPLYSELFSYGVDTLYHVRGKATCSYDPEIYADAIKEVCFRVEPATVLIGGTEKGLEIAPLLAAKLKVKMTSDCTWLEMEGRILKPTGKPCSQEICLMAARHTFPQMAVVRPGSFPPPETVREGKGTAIYWQYG